MVVESPDPIIVREIANFGLRTCAPIYWHDRALPWPKAVHGASCFFLQFAAQVTLVTAWHVLDAYRRTKAATPSIVCQVGTTPHNPSVSVFDPEESLIDCDSDLDIATFRFSQEQVTASEHVAITCSRDDWPPPDPEIHRALQLVGFPNLLWELHPNSSGTFAAYIALTGIEAVTEHEIVVTHDPTKDRALAPNLPMPALGFNMSGCSGGPAIAYAIKGGLLRWFPVGLIVGSSGAGRSGEMNEFDIIRVRRINSVCSDGTIARRAGSGWLPR